jgi:phosphoribosylformimino-5-aminoimidazole carboxamide ribotide isomerase|tara:strand:+ start:860 stop:1576 length:717 start_codon:yes stop_codon:yes gene_type:complete
MNIIPAIDIYENKCVRLYKGEYDKLTVYSDNPVEVIRQWGSYGAEWIHIIDLEGARKGTPISKELIREMVENTNLKIQIGGGIRNLDTIKYYFSLGVEKIILGSAAIKNENNFVSKSIQEYGSAHITISVDSSDGKVKSEGWEKEMKLSPEQFISNMIKVGVTNFIYTDIDKDGTFGGVYTKFISKIMQQFQMNLIVAGGVSSESDINSLNELGVDGVIIGKAFYENYLNPTIINKYN